MASADSALAAYTNTRLRKVGIIQLPAAPFAPDADWRHHYRVLTTPTARPTESASLLIERRVQHDHLQLSIERRNRAVSGFTRIVRTTARCHPDRLTSPFEWTTERRVIDSAGSPPEHLRTHTKAGAVRDGRLTLDPGGPRRDPGGLRVDSARPPAGAERIDGQYTAFWCLFDSVQRLPVDDDGPVRLTLIHEFDQLAAGCTLTFRGQHHLVLGGVSTRLAAFELTGPGMLPTIFWRTGDGRVVVVLSGLEIHLLTAPPPDQPADVAQERSQ